MKLETETREAIRANRILLAGGLAVVWTVKALKVLEGRLQKAGLEREPFTEISCKHAWNTQDEAFGAVYCLACGEPNMVKLAQDTMDRCCPPERDQ